MNTICRFYSELPTAFAAFGMTLWSAALIPEDRFPLLLNLGFFNAGITLLVYSFIRKLYLRSSRNPALKEKILYSITHPGIYNIQVITALVLTLPLYFELPLYALFATAPAFVIPYLYGRKKNGLRNMRLTKASTLLGGWLALNLIAPMLILGIDPGVIFTESLPFIGLLLLNLCLFELRDVNSPPEEESGNPLYRPERNTALWIICSGAFCLFINWKDISLNTPFILTGFIFLILIGVQVKKTAEKTYLHPGLFGFADLLLAAPSIISAASFILSETT